MTTIVTRLRGWSGALSRTAFPLKGRAFLALTLVPVLVAAGLLLANWAHDTRLVKAAIVNLDQPVTIDGQYTPLGRQLTAALVDSKRSENLTWVMATPGGAAAGLATGEYAAVGTIPPEFSAAATSFAGSADAVVRAVIQIQTSPAAGVTDAALSQVIAREATDILNSSLTNAYLDQIYLGFNELGSQFNLVALSATELADGVEQYVDGIGQGVDGLTALAGGAHYLSTGLNTMANQSVALPTGLRQLADGERALLYGTPQQPGGMVAMAAGLQTLQTQTATLPASAAQLSTGASQLADGVTQYVGGINGTLDQVIAALETQKWLLEGIKTLTSDPAAITAAAEALRQGLDAIQHLATLSVQPLDQFVTGLPESLQCPAQLTANACDAYYMGLQAGMAAEAQAMAAALQDQTVGPLLAYIATLPDTLESIDIPADGVDVMTLLATLRDGGQQLEDGANQLADGTAQLAAGLPLLTSGISQLANGSSAMVTGTKQLSAGLDAVAGQMPALVTGIRSAANGASALASGADALVTGFGPAVEGGQELVTGSRQLADGLTAGLNQLPQYSDTERQTLAQVVASPIAATTAGGTWFGPGWAALILLLALWLGAFATYLVVRPVRDRQLGSSASTFALAAQSLAPGLVVMLQAVLMAGIALAVLQLPMGRSLAVAGLALLAGAAFVVVNYALVAWLKGAGQLVAVVFAVLALVSGLTAATPGVFTVARAVSPLTPALDAVHAVIAGGTGVAASTLVLVGWLLLGLAATGLAALRSRTTTFDALPAPARHARDS